MEHDRIPLQNKLIEIRKRRGMTQEFLARKSNISKVQYSKIERRESWPRLGTAYRISKALNLPMEEIWDLESWHKSLRSPF